MRWQIGRADQTGLGEIGFTCAGGQQNGLHLRIIGVAVTQQLRADDGAAHRVDGEGEHIVLENDQATVDCQATCALRNSRYGTRATTCFGG